MWPKIQSVLGCRLVGREYVVITRLGENDVCIVLNPAGSRAFALMDGRRDLREIAQILAEDTQRDPPSFEGPLAHLVNALEQLSVLKISSTPWKTPFDGYLRQAPPISSDDAPPDIEEWQELELAAGGKQPRKCFASVLTCSPQLPDMSCP